MGTALMRFISLVAVFVTLSVPARADWKFTKWGMTPEQVVEASAGAARMSTPDEVSENSPADGSAKALATMPYDAGDIHFNVAFDFGRDNKLRVIVLTVTSGDIGYKLQNALVAKYGAPLEPDNNGGVWLSQNDRIAYMRSLGILQYEPRKTAVTNGL